MNIRDNQNIKVLYYGTSPVAVKGEMKEYLFDGAIDGIPTVYYMPFREIEFINSRSIVFRSGVLEFEESVRDEIYSALNMPNWRETVLFESTIEELLLNPTEENIKRIIAIKDIFVFERIRGKLVYWTNEGIRNISNKVIEVVNARFRELNCGVSKSKLVIHKAQPQAQNNDEVAALKEQLAQMQAMMQQLMQAQQASVETKNVSEQAVESVPVQNPEKVETKKPNNKSKK